MQNLFRFFSICDVKFWLVKPKWSRLVSIVSIVIIIKKRKPNFTLLFLNTLKTLMLLQNELAIVSIIIKRDLRMETKNKANKKN